MKKVVLTLALLSMASLAAADPIVHLEAVPQGSPPGYSNLQVYQVYLVAEPGYVVTGFDGAFLGSMWQEWSIAGETVFLDDLVILEALNPGASERDTHLMWSPQDLVIPSSGTRSFYPHEGAPVPPDSGVGLWFAHSETEIMAFSFATGQSDNVLLAQIVLPSGGEVLVAGNAGYKWGEPPQYDQNPVELLIPEPTSLSLLALGTVLALVRRRRS